MELNVYFQLKFSVAVLRGAGNNSSRKIVVLIAFASQNEIGALIMPFRCKPPALGPKRCGLANIIAILHIIAQPTAVPRIMPAY